VFQGAAVYIMPATGGRAVRLEAGLESMTAHTWSPDGRHLSVLAMPKLAGPRDQTSVFIVPVNGGLAVRTDFYELMQREGFSNRTPPTAWLAAGNRLVLHGHRGDMWNVWALPMDSSYRLTGKVERLTHGTEDEESPAVSPAGHVILFTAVDESTRIFSSSTWRQALAHRQTVGSN
jgi:Tol biopolymer transport system component